MVRIGLLIAAAMTLAPVAASAQAKIDFAVYEGPPQIVTGTGGTKITKNGIDYWTSGTPPRRYEIIAFVQDRRDEYFDGGHAVGSPNIAKKVKNAGGHAVIVQSQDEAGSGGSYGSFFPSVGFFAGGGSKTITRMLVVRYLPNEADAQAVDRKSPSEVP